MSKITLEDLHADFEAKRDAYHSVYKGCADEDLRLYGVLDWNDVDACVHAAEIMIDGVPLAIIEPCSIQVLKAAKLYIVARDEGTDAAMVWKLANW